MLLFRVPISVGSPRVTNMGPCFPTLFLRFERTFPSWAIRRFEEKFGEWALPAPRGVGWHIDVARPLLPIDRTPCCGAAVQEADDHDPCRDSKVGKSGHTTASAIELTIPSVSRAGWPDARAATIVVEITIASSFLSPHRRSSSRQCSTPAWKQTRHIVGCAAPSCRRAAVPCLDLRRHKIEMAWAGLTEPRWHGEQSAAFGAKRFAELVILYRLTGRSV